MQKKDVTIRMKNSVDARPAAMLVQVASRFRSEIFVQMENKKMNAKSIMGMMSLGLDNGETVTISAEGADEAEAMKEIEAYLTHKNVG